MTPDEIVQHSLTVVQQKPMTEEGIKALNEWIDAPIAAHHYTSTAMVEYITLEPKPPFETTITGRRIDANIIACVCGDDHDLRRHMDVAFEAAGYVYDIATDCYVKDRAATYDPGPHLAAARGVGVIAALFGSLFGGGVTYTWRPDAEQAAANVYARNIAYDRDALGRTAYTYRTLPAGIFWERTGGRTHTVTIRRKPEIVPDWGAIGYLMQNTTPTGAT